MSESKTHRHCYPTTKSMRPSSPKIQSTDASKINKPGSAERKRAFNSSSVSSRCRTSRTSKSKPELKRNTKSRSCEGDIEDIGDSLKGVSDFTKEEASDIGRCLLEWYDVNKRDLPWRNTNGNEQKRAYAVWVSEIMLQQTRVASVISYYNQWMQKWPSIHDLAQATQEEVNHMWAGLGYYRRARFLLEGAKEIVELKGGVFPCTVDDLKKVRGIGNYTAGAIASIVFQQVVPVVDGNVVRVICRLKAISANPKSTATVKRLWDLASQLVDQNRPGEFNQALMELGATLCTASNPSCSICPVAENCQALLKVKMFSVKSKIDLEDLLKGRMKPITAPSVTDYPVKVSKPKPREECAAVCVVEVIPNNVDCDRFKDTNKNMFLLVKRPGQGLLAGLWEFPSVILTDPDATVHERKEAVDEYLEHSLGLFVNPRSNMVILRESIGEYTHVFSHIRLHMYIEWLVIRTPEYLHEMKESTDENTITWKWIDKKTVQTMGLTSGVKKVYLMMQECRRTQEMRNAAKRTKKK